MNSPVPVTALVDDYVRLKPKPGLSDFFPEVVYLVKGFRIPNLHMNPVDTGLGNHMSFVSNDIKNLSFQRYCRSFIISYKPTLLFMLCLSGKTEQNPP